MLLGRRQADRTGSPASDPGHLGPGLVRPQTRPELLEDPQRPTERIPRQPPLLRTAERLALCEERPPELEGLIQQPMTLQGPLERGERLELARVSRLLDALPSGPTALILEGTRLFDDPAGEGSCTRSVVRSRSGEDAVARDLIRAVSRDRTDRMPTSSVKKSAGYTATFYRSAFLSSQLVAHTERDLVVMPVLEPLD
jgi:hypothetical protein